MLRHILPVAFVLAAAPAWAQPPAASAAPEAASKPEVDANGLLVRPGHDVTVRVCANCHKPTIILSKRLDRSEWTDLVFNMADRGAKASDEELAQIIDYLTASYPREAAKPTAGTPTP